MSVARCRRAVRESEPLIAEMVTMLKANPTLRLGVEGHTDNTGTPAGNKTLSENRAASVWNTQGER